ncbi:protein FAR1-RELATED SEQUENCE 9-like [Olea europaea var. sylvestris]|uniref:protein FAR1-RELATED SEQUENCE 9-like n=1 Tax=Olea europaea var. sylvestris TaxID=158386 RepID=UPI000C1CF9E8|nr:protein FAR1-RELATED SEQUENCE 9-like [Olea europaea var. sylvestris]
MPFAPFVGVNHHRQLTLLGCDLVSNEDTNTFVWLFKTWLKCMGDKAPHGIITDQDRAMQNAIEIVFPNTKHRLYENRIRWVPCFLRTTFWAGMSTTQRSESMNTFFNGYVHAKTSLKQFVEQYERALQNKVEKEFIANFKSFSQVLPGATTYEIEKQYQLCYTISKFREVQSEFTGKMYCDLIFAVEGHMGTKYEVREDIVCGERQKKTIFLVWFNREKCEVNCSYHLFEFREILCRHAIVVLIRNDFTVMLDRYILRRWRKDVSRAHTRVVVHYDGLVTTPAQMRYDDMRYSFAAVANLAADNEGKYRVIMDWIQLQKKELSSTKFDRSGIVRDPKTSKRKGAPRTKRRKGPLEARSNKSKTETSVRGRLEYQFRKHLVRPSS